MKTFSRLFLKELKKEKLKTWDRVGNSAKMLHISPERACSQLKIFHHLHIFQLLKFSYAVRNNEEGTKKSNDHLFQENINSSIIGFAFSSSFLEFLAVNNLIL